MRQPAHVWGACTCDMGWCHVTCQECNHMTLARPRLCFYSMHSDSWTSIMPVLVFLACMLLGRVPVDRQPLGHGVHASNLLALTASTPYSRCSQCSQCKGALHGALHGQLCACSCSCPVMHTTCNQLARLSARPCSVPNFILFPC